jgi:hypothetical protein
MPPSPPATRSTVSFVQGIQVILRIASLFVYSWSIHGCFSQQIINPTCAGTLLQIQKILNYCKTLFSKPTPGVQAMVIVPLGKLLLRGVENDALDFAGQVLKNIEKSLPKWIAPIINEY